VAEAAASRSCAHSLLPIRASYRRVNDSVDWATRSGKGWSGDSLLRAIRGVLREGGAASRAVAPGVLGEHLGLASGSRASGGRGTPDAPELGVPTAVMAVEGGGSILASAHCWKEGWERGHPPAIAVTGLRPRSLAGSRRSPSASSPKGSNDDGGHEHARLTSSRSDGSGGQRGAYDNDNPARAGLDTRRHKIQEASIAVSRLRKGGTASAGPRLGSWLRLSQQVSQHFRGVPSAESVSPMTQSDATYRPWRQPRMGDWRHPRAKHSKQEAGLVGLVGELVWRALLGPYTCG